MSWFTDLLVRWLTRDGASQKRSFLQNQVGSLLNKYTGAGLTGAEQEANQFTAEQAEQANERNVFNYQHRYQWEVDDMQRAGLNPALLYGGSPGSGSVSSAPAGSSVSPTGSGMSDLVGSIMDLALLKAQIKNINADTANKSAEATGKAIENEFKPDLFRTELAQGRMNIENTKAGIALAEKQLDVFSSQVSLNEAQVKQVFSLANKTDIEAVSEQLRQKGIETSNDLIAQNLVNAKLDALLKVLEQSVLKSQVSVNYAQAGVLKEQKVYLEFQKQFRETFGTNPDEPIWNGILGILGKLSNEMSDSNGFDLFDLKGQSDWIADFLKKVF